MRGWERLLRSALDGFVARGANGHATSARVELEREPGVNPTIAG
jgi:hypothetical protein